jgi:hypothetical protein
MVGAAVGVSANDEAAETADVADLDAACAAELALDAACSTNEVTRYGIWVGMSYCTKRCAAA